MLDIHDNEVVIGDRVLVAFSSSGYTYLKYARITSMTSDKYSCKVRFEDTRFMKTKTVSGIYKNKLLKVDEGH